MTELAINIANTLAFIDADPSVVDIKRDPYISDGAGGRKKSTSPLDVAPSAIVRMIPQGADNATTNPVTQTTNGELQHPDMVLLASPEVVLQRKDYFDWHGRTWEVVGLRESPSYETKADVGVREDS